VPLTALCVAIAESLDFLATKLEAAVASGTKLNSAIQTLLCEVVKEHGGVVYNGNGYTAEWHAEAEKRGLPNYRNTVAALPVLEKKESIELFDKYEVLTPRELHSRYEIMLEQYNKSVLVEARLAVTMARTQILPAALRYQAELAQGIGAAKAAGLSVSTATAEQVTKLAGEVEAQTKALESALAHESGDALEEAKHLEGKVLSVLSSLRSAVDGLEVLVADDLWPLPTYQEMLFMR
jgi:glutamine synthetase